MGGVLVDLSYSLVRLPVMIAQVCSHGHSRVLSDLPVNQRRRMVKVRAALTVRVGLKGALRCFFTLRREQKVSRLRSILWAVQSLVSIPPKET
jgi:hypothetical protein